VTSVKVGRIAERLAWPGGPFVHVYRPGADPAYQMTAEFAWMGLAQCPDNKHKTQSAATANMNGSPW
jgi:hypothetical protein